MREKLEWLAMMLAMVVEFCIGLGLAALLVYLSIKNPEWLFYAAGLGIIMFLVAANSGGGR